MSKAPGSANAITLMTIVRIVIGTITTEAAFIRRTMFPK